MDIKKYCKNCGHELADLSLNENTPDICEDCELDKKISYLHNRGILLGIDYEIGEIDKFF